MAAIITGSMWTPALDAVLAGASPSRRALRAGTFACALAALAALTGLAGCGAVPPSPRPAPRDVGPLITLVPRGSTLVVVARPSELMAAEATVRVATAIFPVEQLDRFTERTGVDPRRLVELVVAEHPQGRIVLARGPFDGPFAVREAGERMAPLESTVDEPFARRAGFLGDRRVEVAALAPDVVAWVEGTPQLAGWLLAAARRPPDERRHGLRDVRELLSASLDAPIVFVAPHPLGLPIDTGVGMLLARERVLTVAARPTEDGTLRIHVELRGEFPAGAQDNFRALARSLAETDFGAALGARDALPSLRIEADEGRVALSAELHPGALAAGLRALLVAELRELLSPLDGDDPPATPPARPQDGGAAPDRGGPPRPRPLATTSEGVTAEPAPASPAPPTTP